MISNNFAYLVSMPELEVFFRTALYPKRLVGIECIQKGKMENTGKIIVEERGRFEFFRKRIQYFVIYDDLQLVIKDKETAIKTYSLEGNTDWICYLLNLSDEWRKGYKTQIRKKIEELSQLPENEEESSKMVSKQLVKLLLG